MGLLSASGRFTRFLVEEPLPKDYLETFPKRIVRYAFRGIDESSYDERAVGWVNILDMFDSAFLGMEFLKEPYVAMSWRVDVRKVPSKALKQYCREAEAKIKEADGLDYLPKERRQDIKEMMHAKLLKRAIPRSQTYDMIWNLQTGVVIFGGTISKLCDEFREFFHRCFDIHLKSFFPFFMASQIVTDQGMAPGLLDDLGATISGSIK